MARRKQGNRKVRVGRIYNGPAGFEKDSYWPVRVRPAKKSVIMTGKAAHALRAHAGVTTGCGFSLMAEDPINAPAFPHDVIIAAFTKTTALIADKKKKDGSPGTAVEYRHNFGKLIDWNDDGSLKKLVREDPTIFEREFTLTPPRKRRKHTGSETSRNRTTSETKSHRGAFVPRGALARAVEAGLIGQHVAEQMSRMAKQAAKKRREAEATS